MNSIFSPVLTSGSATHILSARDEKVAVIRMSTDLGLSTSDIIITPEGARFPNGHFAEFDKLSEMSSSPETCFILENGTLTPIRLFSGSTGRSVSLLPTGSAPALMLSGFLMHRIKNTDPWTAAITMVAALGKKITGRILDTATGLGYTSIIMAEKGAEVMTIELDPSVREIAAKNPWSRRLFNNPSIKLLSGDSSELIATFGDSSFDAVFHDPPAFDFAGELYSESFYRQAFRILSRRGRMFHYIGDPSSSNGARVTKGVLKRLGNAGFQKVILQPEAFGVLAFK
jgi:predicted methyltransferase